VEPRAERYERIQRVDFRGGLLGGVEPIAAAALAAGVATAAGPVPAALAAASPRTAVPAASPRPRTARLQGQFALQGRITSVSNVLGVRAGQRFKRKWTFIPLCAAGVCQRVRLVRALNHGTDRLVLSRRGPGYYVGTGRLYAPLRCGGQTYAKGETVPFTITVRIKAAARVSGLVVATRLKATYTNPYRTNLTPCVTAPGHVSATYRGGLI
jgi:hypothetical protein